MCVDEKKLTNFTPVSPAQRLGNKPKKVKATEIPFNELSPLWQIQISTKEAKHRQASKWGGEKSERETEGGGGVLVAFCMCDKVCVCAQTWCVSECFWNFRKNTYTEKQTSKWEREENESCYAVISLFRSHAHSYCVGGPRLNFTILNNYRKHREMRDREIHCLLFLSLAVRSAARFNKVTSIWTRKLNIMGQSREG